MTKEDLELLIKEGEGLSVEFKEKYSPRIDRDLVAFANAKGGRILLGVSDQGKILGEILTNRLKAEINDLARKCDPCLPIRKMSQVGKLVVIEIREGDDKPHSCGSGYFRRLDASTQKMNRKELRLLFQTADAGASFEEKIHREIGYHDISRVKIKTFFREAGIGIKKIEVQKILSSLNLSTGKGIKNAGVLFFATQPRKFILQSEMILAAFKGKDRLHVYDRSDVQDDLLTQFNEAMIFLQKHLNVRSEIKGVNRYDIYELPLEALREAVANAIIHRDYSMRGTSTMVEVHQDRVVIKNPGGIPNGLNPRSLTNVSIRRNELIADLFARMGKVERMGTGIKRMRETMREACLPYPKINSDLFFTITLRRPVSGPGAPGGGGQKRWSEKVVGKGGQKKGSELGEKRRTLLELIGQDPKISRKALASQLGINESAIQKHIQRLKHDGLIRRVGPAKGGYWQVNEEG